MLKVYLNDKFLVSHDHFSRAECPVVDGFRRGLGQALEALLGPSLGSDQLERSGHLGLNWNSKDEGARSDGWLGRFTVNIELYSFGHGRRNSVGSDTHVGSHLTPRHFVELDLCSRHLLSYKQTISYLTITTITSILHLILFAPFLTVIISPDGLFQVTVGLE